MPTDDNLNVKNKPTELSQGVHMPRPRHCVALRHAVQLVQGPVTAVAGVLASKTLDIGQPLTLTHSWSAGSGLPRAEQDGTVQ